MSSPLGYRTGSFTVITLVSSFIMIHALSCVNPVTTELILAPRPQEGDSGGCYESIWKLAFCPHTQHSPCSWKQSWTRSFMAV